ncbi:MAG: hypothetical protein JWQ30_470, partial [Sediminibacterium sp.]|nr:hypothetical protein [Sediminibacterium sp.]
KSFMKWVLPFLMFIFFGEIAIAYLYFNNPSWPNTSFYYIIGISESIFYGYIFYRLCQSAIVKKIIFILTLIGLSIYSFGFVFYPNDYTYYIFSLIVSGFFFSFISLTYIYIDFSNDSQNSMVFDSGFWIAFGVSLFFSGISIVFCLHDYIVKHNLNLFGIRLYNIVPRILCVILYLSISISIILCKKKTKISL